MINLKPQPREVTEWTSDNGDFYAWTSRDIYGKKTLFVHPLRQVESTATGSGATLREALENCRLKLLALQKEVAARLEQITNHLEESKE